MASKEDINLFINEAEDLIQKVEDQILKLEQNPEDNKPIKELYFAFHTLKGLTAMVRLENVSKLCHNFENMLDESKEKRLSEEKIQEIIELMFKCLDILHLVLKKVREGEVSDIDHDLVSELQKSFEKTQKEYEITFIKPIEPDEASDILDDDNKNVYKIDITIQSTCVFKKVRLFIIFRALNGIGRLIWSDPEPSILEAGEINFKFKVYFATSKTIDDIHDTLDEILEIENKVIELLDNEEVEEIFRKTKKQKIEKPPVPIPLENEGKIDEEDLNVFSQALDDFETDIGKITSVKVKIDVLEKLMDYFGEVVILKNQLSQLLAEESNWEITNVFDNMDKLFLEIQEIVFKLKLVRVESTFRRYKRLVRDIAKDTGKDIKFKLEGTDIELDRKILEELNSPLIHLLRNAIYHGIESPSERIAKGKPEEGNLKLKTFRRAGSVYIQVIDDGRGINYDKVREKLVNSDQFTWDEASKLNKETLNKIIFTPGFSTLSDADMISGRGMGLAIVSEKIKELGGEMSLESRKDRGTIFTLSVPFSRAILKAQLMKIAGDLYAIPIENITQIYFFKKELIEYIKGEEYYRLNSRLIPIIRLRKYLDIQALRLETGEQDTENGIKDQRQDIKNNKDKIAILCNKGQKNAAIFIVDEILHQMDIVIKPFRSKFSSFQEILGVSITGDGSICLIIDVLNIITSMSKSVKNVQMIEK
ncbi:MAG: hypothetical protein GF329_10545 [Candidatus Lokiarchaeota archaeon]|nr:hypothetical protein [Candidatus Lokiarchaeota archaeon]